MIALVAAAASASGGFWGPTLAVGMLTAGVALLTLAVNQIRTRKDRQRELFEGAFAAVTAYREYPFVVRRRNENGTDRQAITTELSHVQAQLNQYGARLRVEARRVGHAYAQLVTNTRRVAGAEIARSWDLPPIPPDGPMHVRDVDLSELAASDEVFLREIGDELAVLPGWLRRTSRAAWCFVVHPRRHRTATVPAAPRVARAEARQ